MNGVEFGVIGVSASGATKTIYSTFAGDTSALNTFSRTHYTKLKNRRRAGRVGWDDHREPPHYGLRNRRRP